MWPYLKENFILESCSLDLFNKEYHWSSRNRDDCSYSYLTLQEIIDNTSTQENLMVTTDILNLPVVNCFDFFLEKVLIYWKMQTTDFHPLKIFHCPCLINVIDNIFDSGFWSFSEILAYLKNLEIYGIEKIFRVRVNKQKGIWLQFATNIWKLQLLVCLIFLVPVIN